MEIGNQTIPRAVTSYNWLKRDQLILLTDVKGRCSHVYTKFRFMVFDFRWMCALEIIRMLLLRQLELSLQMLFLHSRTARTGEDPLIISICCGLRQLNVATIHSQVAVAYGIKTRLLSTRKLPWVLATRLSTCK